MPCPRERHADPVPPTKIGQNKNVVQMMRKILKRSIQKNSDFLEKKKSFDNIFNFNLLGSHNHYH